MHNPTIMGPITRWQVIEAIEQRAAHDIDSMRLQLKGEITKRDIFERTAAVRKLLRGAGASLAAALNTFTRKEPQIEHDKDEEIKNLVHDLHKHFGPVSNPSSPPASPPESPGEDVRVADHDGATADSFARKPKMTKDRQKELWLSANRQAQPEVKARLFLSALTRDGLTRVSIKQEITQQREAMERDVALLEGTTVADDTSKPDDTGKFDDTGKPNVKRKQHDMLERAQAYVRGKNSSVELAGVSSSVKQLAATGAQMGDLVSVVGQLDSKLEQISSALERNGKLLETALKGLNEFINKQSRDTDKLHAMQQALLDKFNGDSDAMAAKASEGARKDEVERKKAEKERELQQEERDLQGYHRTKVDASFDQLAQRIEEISRKLDGRFVDSAPLGPQETPQLQLPGGFVVGDKLFYNAPNEPSPGGRILYGQQGTVQGPAVNESQRRDQLAMTFPTIDRPVDCLHFKLSREKPGPLPGGFILLELLYYRGKSEAGLASGDRGEVVGPATFPPPDGALGLAMQFPGSDSWVACRVHELSRDPPGTLPGGYEIGEAVHFIGPHQMLRSGSRLQHGRQGKVAGWASDETHTGRGVRQLLAIEFTDIEESIDFPLYQLSRSPPEPLPAGYDVGDTLYSTGPSVKLAGGITRVYGHQGEVVARASSEEMRGEKEGLAMLFQRNDDLMDCWVSQLSRSPPEPLPGGYEPGDHLFYVSPGESRGPGYKLTYGEQGEVVAAATSEDLIGKGLAMQFYGNHGTIDCALLSLSSDPAAPLPGGYTVEEKLYYKAENVAVNADPVRLRGGQLMYGLSGKVVGPAETAEMKGNGLAVLFQGNPHYVDCFVYQLQRDIPVLV